MDGASGMWGDDESHCPSSEGASLPSARHKEVIFGQARLYRNLGLGWSKLQFCSCLSTVILHYIPSQDHLKALPTPLQVLIPPLLSNVSLHSDPAELTQSIQSQSEQHYWNPSFLQANNAASPCFVLRTEQQGRENSQSLHCPADQDYVALH